MAQHTIDVEAGQRAKPSRKPVSPAGVIQVAALLSLWSLLLVNEGSIRLIESNPSVRLLDSGRPSQFMPFLGGVLEILFGLFGLFVGMGAFLLRRHATPMTKLSMVVQSILSYYVFAVFVFVVPIFRIIDLEDALLPGMSIAQGRFFLAMGIATSFHFCLSLQGGHFVFMARLVATATDENFMAHKNGSKLRAIFWNGNLATAGVWTFLTGVVLRATVGGGRLSEAFNAPPHVGVLPGMTIFSGVLMAVWGVVGITLAVCNSAPLVYGIGSCFVYFALLLNFGVLQVGLIDGGSAGDVALHNGLVFAVVFMGTYFVYEAVEERRRNSSTDST